MLKKNSLSFRKAKFAVVNLVLLICVFSIEVFGQTAPARVPPAPEKGEDFTWWYITLLVLVLGLAGAIFWWLNGKKAKKDLTTKAGQKNTKENDWDRNSLDADKEMEWLRKNQKLVGKKAGQRPRNKKRPSSLPSAETMSNAGGAGSGQDNLQSNKIDKPALPFPVFSIERLESARHFDDLPVSNEDALMNAIEQTHDEFEEDEEVRDLTMRILAMFRAKNSVEALSQFALYDLSSNLRSKAVTTLSEFNHESVFETILLANADPTREVRAAAARGLTKLTFNRADSWTRIGETDDEGRVLQAARAAVESGFVDMSFDRLVHQDRKNAYEAFALMALLIKAGETEKIFNAMETHRDMNVRKALLHTIKATKDQKALDGLYSMLERNNLPIEFQEEVDKAIEEIGFVTV